MDPIVTGRLIGGFGRIKQVWVEVCLVSWALNMLYLWHSWERFTALLVHYLSGTGEESRRESQARCRFGANTPAGLNVSLRPICSFGLLACLVLRMQFSGEEYLAAGDDPVAAFAAPIAAHMNADHAEVLALTYC